MDAVNVFISYSAEKKNGVVTPDGQTIIDLRDTINKILTDKKHQVKFDQKDIKLGMQWRHEINVWLSACQVAILLIDKAALVSEYVAYEISILHHRREMQGHDKFLIIPIFLEDIGKEPLEQSLLKSIPLFEIQSHVKKTDDQTTDVELAEKVASIIRETPNTHADYKRKVRYIADDVFKDLTTPVLEDSAEILKITNDSWLPYDNLKERVALELFSSGITATTKKSMVDLKQYLSHDKEIRKNKMEDLLGLVSSSWIDDCCINDIKNNWQHKFFFLNNYDAQLPQFYLYNIKPPTKSWVLIKINHIADSDFLDGLIATIWRNLKNRLGETDKGILLEQLVDEEQYAYERPVCISLVLDILTSEIVNRLLAAFPKVVFFFVVKNDMSRSQGSWQHQLVPLSPFLSKDEEDTLCQSYSKCRDRMLREEF